MKKKKKKKEEATSRQEKKEKEKKKKKEGRSPCASGHGHFRHLPIKFSYSVLSILVRTFW